MKDGVVLATGATGLHGGVGGYVVRQLAASGARVRALVHRRDERSVGLEAIGVDTIEGDMLDAASLRKACKDVDRILFCYPIREGLLEAGLNVATVAREIGTRALIDLSLIAAREGSPSDEAREHVLLSRAFDWAGINPVHLMGGFFYENLGFLAGEDWIERGALEIPFGDGDTPISWIAAEDAARFAVGALRDPKPFINKTHYVTGPEALSLKDVAAVASSVFNKPVRYDGAVDPDVWTERLKAHPLANPRLLKHARVLATAFSGGASFGKVSDAVEQASGVKPITLATYLSRLPAGSAQTR